MIAWADIAAMFDRIEAELIASFKRNLAPHRAWEKGEGFAWPAWQAEKLKNIWRYRNQNKRLVRKYAPVIDRETAELLREQFSEGSDGFFGVNTERLDRLIDEMQRTERRVERAALRMMDDVYRRTIYQASAAMATGSVTLPKAIDMAAKDFLAAGIRCVEYKDGRRVNIADYAHMALHTAAARSAMMGDAARRARLGIDTVLVSQYGACSETCLPWQGQAYIDDVFGDWNGERAGQRGRSRNGLWYPLLSAAVEGGLFHPNCRHTVTDWIEGVSRLPKPMDGKAIRENAELERRQRELERRVRKYKRLEIGSQEPDAVKRYAEKRRAAQSELREFVHEHADVLRRDYWREKAYVASDNIDNLKKNDIIKSGRDSVGISIEVDKFTPCLVEKETGKIINTKYSVADRLELKDLQKQGWKFDWTSNSLYKSVVYKLSLENDNLIQGLIAVTDFPQDKALYVNIAESAPHNLGQTKQYEGVGGHLFAIAANESVNKGYGGFLFLDAKNIELVQYYHDKFGATLVGMPHPYRMFIDENNARNLLEIYELKGE